jgi:excisionase family DNA binding protein
MVLTEQDVEAVARRTVELLRGERAGSFALVGARELAEHLGVSVDYVYEHAGELGALRLGGGRKARIRFEVATARRALEARQTSLERPRKSGAQRR